MASPGRAELSRDARRKAGRRRAIGFPRAPYREKLRSSSAPAADGL